MQSDLPLRPLGASISGEGERPVHQLVPHLIGRHVDSSLLWQLTWTSWVRSTDQQVLVPRAGGPLGCHSWLASGSPSGSPALHGARREPRCEWSRSPGKRLLCNPKTSKESTQPGVEVEHLKALFKPFTIRRITTSNPEMSLNGDRRLQVQGKERQVTTAEAGAPHQPCCGDPDPALPLPPGQLHTIADPTTSLDTHALPALP